MKSEELNLIIAWFYCACTVFLANALQREFKKFPLLHAQIATDQILNSYMDKILRKLL